jgi:hypothetical protein
MMTIAFVLLFVAVASATQEAAETTVATLTPGSKYGYGFAVSNNFVIVGAPGDSSLTNVTNSGSAYIYNCSSPTTCALTLNLTSPNPQMNDSYGTTVGVNNSLVAVGAGLANNGSGAVYIYQCLTTRNCLPGSVLTSPTAARGDQFGWNLSVWKNWVLVGSLGHLNSTGAAYLYNCSNYLNCTLATTLNPAAGKVGGQFGFSVGLSDWLVVIGSGNSTNGEAYAYNCNSNTGGGGGGNSTTNVTIANSTSSTTCTQIAKLTPPTLGNNITNATNTTTGGDNSTSTQKSLATMLYVAGDIVYVGVFGGQNSTGAVHVYNCSSKTNCTWASAIIPLNITAGANFGSFISAYQDKLVIGAPYAENGKGAAYVLDCKDATVCKQTDYLVASDGMKGDRFGLLTGVNDNTIFVLAPYKNQATGSMYTFWANSTSSMP